MCVGTELSSKKKTVIWPEEDADETEDDVEHTLFLHYVSKALDWTSNCLALPGVWWNYCDAVRL